MAAPDLRRFGQALADALAFRDVTQEDLALLLGKAQSTVSSWVNGKAEPSPAVVFRVEKALELLPGHLSVLLGYLPVEALRRQ